ncbi:MAG TPA: aminoalkylphosphonic acid N-acetyltransferase [Bacteroidales bacterium]|nr:aminoalkylphosphonic acid N-acetyltransferase [Bacteroidales bacterium]
MQPQIRNANIDDLNAIYNLVCDLEACEMEKISFENIFKKNIADPNVHYIVAQIDKRIVGFISLHVQYILHHSNPTCELQELNIVPELRGSGIGGLLMVEAEKVARGLNLEEIELTTKIHRERAQTFYKKLGYIHSHNKYVKKL